MTAQKFAVLIVDGIIVNCKDLGLKTMKGLDMYECVWYNASTSCYELLDFNPNGLSNQSVKRKAWSLLNAKYGFEKFDYDKVMETLYLLPSKSLKSLED